MSNRIAVQKGVPVGSRKGRKKPALAGFVKRRDGLEGVREPEMARLNGACYREVVEEVMGRVMRWEAEMAKVEWLMAEVGRGMRVLQPNRAGRLVVRWWMQRGDEPWRTPLLLRLMVKEGVSVLEPVGPKVKPLGNGYFKTTRAEVAGLLSAWWRLVEVREWLVGELSGLGRVKAGRRIEVFDVVERLSGEVDGLVALGRRKVALMRGDGQVEWESDDGDEAE